MSDSTSTPKDVFISYRREERPQVVRLAEALRGMGLTIWFDASLEPGSSFDEEIAREITSARAVLVCWSKGSVASRWVRSEAMIGSSRSALIPIFLEPCDLMPPFNIEHAEDLSDWNGQAGHEGWQKVIARLGALTGRGDALTRWLAAQAAETAAPYRDFLKRFPTDPLAAIAKERIWSLELSATRRRLTDELGLSMADESTAEQVRALTVEIEELRARAASASSARQAAEERARQAEAKAAATEVRERDAVSRSQAAPEVKAAAEARASDGDTRQPWTAGFGPRGSAIVIVLASLLLGIATSWTDEISRIRFYRLLWELWWFVAAMSLANVLWLARLWRRSVLHERTFTYLTLASGSIIGLSLGAPRYMGFVLLGLYYAPLYMLLICVLSFHFRWPRLHQAQRAAR